MSNFLLICVAHASLVIDIISIQKLLPKGITGDVHIKVGSVATVDKASGCRIRRTNDETPHKVDKEERRNYGEKP